MAAFRSKERGAAAVFSLRQQDPTTSTTYQIQNTNIRSSAVLHRRLAELRSAGADDVARYAHFASVEMKRGEKSGVDRVPDVTGVCSGIEYLYMAIAALAESRRMTPAVIKMLAAAHGRDPASILLAELARLSREKKSFFRTNRSSGSDAGGENTAANFGKKDSDRTETEQAAAAAADEALSLESICEDVLNLHSRSPPSNPSRSASPDLGGADNAKMAEGDAPSKIPAPTNTISILTGTGASSGSVFTGTSSDGGNDDSVGRDDHDDHCLSDASEDDGDDDDEEDDALDLGGVGMSSTVRRAVMDAWRFGMFLDTQQSASMTETLRDVCHRVMSHLVSRRGILLVLGPFMPKVASRLVMSCPTSEVSEVHLVDNSQRRLRCALQGLLEGKCITRRVFISDSGSARYVRDEPTWEGDRTYDVVTSMFSLHHLNRRDRRSVFRFVQAQCNTFVAVVWFKGEEGGVDRGDESHGLSPRSLCGPGAAASSGDVFDPSTFTALVDSFETGLRQAKEKFEEDIPVELEARRQHVAKKRYALSLLARQFLVTLTLGRAAVNVGSRNPYCKDRSASLEALSCSELCTDMKAEGLVVTSSRLLFDHWWCPVRVIEATSSLSQRQRSQRSKGSEEIMVENEELRARVRQLEQLVQGKAK